MKSATAPIAWIERLFDRLQDATTPQEIALVVDGGREMLEQHGSNYSKIGRDLARAVELRIPAELEPEAPCNVTIARLILTRHRRALGLTGEVVLSGLISKMNTGQPVTRDDLASFRKTQAAVRLTLEGAMV